MPLTCIRTWCELEEFLGDGQYSFAECGGRPLTWLSKQKVIEREMNILNSAEQQANWPKVQAGMLKEFRSWHSLGSWQKILRKHAKNIIDSRWVITWKLINGVKDIKARLVVRGFKDQQGEELNTSASTASRWGQRIVNQVVVEEEWDLFSFDVSTTFLQGLTFQDMYKLGLTTGVQQRQVCLEIPKGSLALVRQLPGMEDFDPDIHVLQMLKRRLWPKGCSENVANLVRTGLGNNLA